MQKPSAKQSNRMIQMSDSPLDCNRCGSPIIIVRISNKEFFARPTQKSLCRIHLDKSGIQGICGTKICAHRENAIKAWNARVKQDDTDE